jgi:peptide deformylase
MTYRELRLVGDPVLRTPCDEVITIDDGIRTLVADLLENVDMEGRAGLAANQIGVDKRVFSYNIEGDIGYVINPVITELSDDYQDGEEGCLSVPELYFPTKRAWFARCEGIDLDGSRIVVEGEELMARCLQHEVDHLDGHLYLDRLDKDTRRRALREVRERF